MPAAIATRTIKDGAGNSFQQQVLDVSGVGSGPFLPLMPVADPTGTHAVDLEALLGVLGTEADAAASGDGSVIAILKQVRQLLGGTLTVQLSGSSVTISGPVTVSNEVEIKNDAGSPVPTNNTGAGLSASGKTAVAGSFTGATSSGAFTPLAGRPFNISLWGTFSATVVLERSFDAGSTWLPLTAGDIALFTWSAPASEVNEEAEVGVQYRLRCSAFTSGTVNYRVSQ